MSSLTILRYLNMVIAFFRVSENHIRCGNGFLRHLRPMFGGFLMFSGGIKMEHWPEMGQAKTILSSEKKNRKIGFYSFKGKLKVLFFAVKFKDGECEYLIASQK